MTDTLLARITSDPGIFGGKPIIRGRRFAVEHLLGYLSAGMTEAELLAEFPLPGAGRHQGGAALRRQAFRHDAHVRRGGGGGQ